MNSYISPSEAAAIDIEFRRLEDTIKTVFWDITWTAWKKERPTTTWDNGSADEEWVSVGSGAGRLRENGAGGPTQGDGILFPESPFRLRTDVTAALDGNTWLVIEDRLFKVDVFKDRGGDRQHATAYLSEDITQELPAVTP